MREDQATVTSLEQLSSCPSQTIQKTSHSYQKSRANGYIMNDYKSIVLFENEKLHLNHAVQLSSLVCGSFRSYQSVSFLKFRVETASHFGHLRSLPSYEALDFLALGDVLSSGFMTPLTEPPADKK